MLNAPTQYALADYINNVNFGIIRSMRFIKVNKSTIGMRLTKILYDLGVLRSFKIEPDYICIYYKFDHGRHIIKSLKVISKPSKRVRWTLKKLVRHYNINMNGFYLISTQDGIYSSEDCLIRLPKCGEILVRVDL